MDTETKNKIQLSTKELLGIGAVGAVAGTVIISQPAHATAAIDDLATSATTIGTMAGALMGTAVLVVGFISAARYFKSITAAR